ncbi:MAG: hypothetical protein Q9M19_02615 [Mariprofundaceae bacterium]|nr:hypothetical protein [Mariprofundaceae bacterium]
MAVFRPIDKADSENAPKPIFKSAQEENQYYYNMLNPQNGMRYGIPMLNTLDPDYYYKYISFMKMKEQSEETFDKMLNWD